MPGTDKIKYKRATTKSMRDQANEFSSVKKKTKSKQANEFAGLGSVSKSKQKQANEFVGIKKKTKPKQANEFAGLGSNKTKTKTKTKTKVITPAMIKAKGFTTLRDYLNNEKGLTRKDGKKVVRTSTAKSSVVKNKPKVSNSGKNKIVPSLKKSSAGIDGGSSQVNKVKPKVNKVKPKVAKKKSSFFDSIGSGIKKAIKETKRNAEGDFKKGTGRYKSLSTGKTNFNKKKKKLAKQISV